MDLADSCVAFGSRTGCYVNCGGIVFRELKSCLFAQPIISSIFSGVSGWLKVEAYLQ